MLCFCPEAPRAITQVATADQSPTPFFYSNTHLPTLYLYVKGGKKSSPNRDSNQRPLAYCASAPTSELLRSDILTVTC